MMLLLFVVAWPLAKLLDCLLGHDNGAYFRRAELAELVRFHFEDNVTENEEKLEADQATIIRGVLEVGFRVFHTNSRLAFVLPRVSSECCVRR